MSRWILLRGLARDRRHWGGFPEQLRAADPGAEILTPDLPGNGERNGETSPDSIAALVEDCRQDLHERGEAGPLRVLALSLGAMVALDWARRYPREIDRCVLINTSLGGASAFYRRLRPRQYPRLLRLAFGASPEAIEAAILAMTSTQRDPELVAIWADYRRRRPLATANVLRQLRAAVRYRAPDAAPPVPVLLLASTRDQLVDVACSRELARRYGWPLVEHASAGHDLPLDDGDWVSEQVRRWLSTAAHDPRQ